MSDMRCLYEHLNDLNQILAQSLPPNEYIWPYSMPPMLPDESEIRISLKSTPEDFAYRSQIAKKYGKKRQLMCGIHVNYSLNNELIDKLFMLQTEFKTKQTFRNELYLKMSRNYLTCQWLLVYLLGATPIAQPDLYEAAFFSNKQLPQHAMRSIRSSDIGFQNKYPLIISYDSIEQYINDINGYVTAGLILHSREFYNKVRLRGYKIQLEDLYSTGIEYLEFRSFDLNPLHPLGLTYHHLLFVHLFIVTMLVLPEKFEVSSIEIGNEKTITTAKEHPCEPSQYELEGIEILLEMKKIAQQSTDTDYLLVVNEAIESFLKPQKTISGHIHTQVKTSDELMDIGIKLSQEFKRSALRDITFK
jgi:glutamate--cysteine ligase/energy-coupling factor transport system ATP-binding protein